ncbi:Homeodomain-like protein, partial [Thelephora terrestris]
GRNNKSCRKRWLHSLDPNLRKGRWTSEEDAALLESVKNVGTRWYEVARALPGRTDDQCAKHYKEALDPSIRRDPWTREEDVQLWSAFKEHGNKWHTVASALQGRPAIHCRNRLQSLQRTRAA